MQDLNTLELRLTAAFPLLGASLSGTEILFFDEDAPDKNLQPLDWIQVAGCITEITDQGRIFSMLPSDFRYYLPGLVLGVARNGTETDTLGSIVLSDLYSYSNPTYWDKNFIGCWCQFTDAQYEVLEIILPPILSEHFLDFQCVIAIETLGLVRMHASDLMQDVD